ncbi:MAG TPA: hypothetical protein VF843_04670 [Streptosporangiaceae bacterium]
MVPRQAQQAALAPVREAMRQHAADRAALRLGQARATAGATVEAAHAAARATIESARAGGIEQAKPVAAAELHRGRQAARSIELDAALATREQIAGRIRTAVLALRDDPDYPRLRDRIAVRAAAAAGPGAQITEHPLGGVIARAGGVVVDCSLPRLAERAITALDARIAGLCGS